MGIVDAFSAEDRVEVKFSDFYNLVRRSTEADVMCNGIKCNVPHKYLREMMSGIKEADTSEGKEDSNDVETGSN